MTTLIYLVIAVTAIIMLSTFAQIDNWSRDWTTNFAELQADSEDPELRPVRLEGPPSEASDRIQQWAQSQKKWAVTSTKTSGDSIRIDLTRTTGIMRFVDDIRVRLEADGDGTIVHATSQSRVGKGDLGQNPRNLKELIKGLK